MPIPTPTTEFATPVASAHPTPGMDTETALADSSAPVVQPDSGSADRQECPPLSYELGQYASSARAFLRGLHLRGKLQPLLRELSIDQQLLRRAEDLGLGVTTAELQSAADEFRRHKGLTSAAETTAWLERERLTVADLEDALKQDLLVAKLRNHVTNGFVAKHFDENRARYDRARVKHLLTGSDDSQTILSELANSVKASLAQRPSPAPGTPSPAGTSGVVFRFQIPSPAAEAVLAAVPGSVVGPVAVPPGQHLLLVETVEPAQLDEVTAQVVREELFAAWMAEHASGDQVVSTLAELV
jgi:parvulin-like peptidyl-prolyl isomerase